MRLKSANDRGGDDGGVAGLGTGTGIGANFLTGEIDGESPIGRPEGNGEFKALSLAS